MKDLLRRWGPFAAAALAVLLFLNILSNTFIWDDWEQIFANSFLRSPGGVAKIFATNVWGFKGEVSNYYRPMMHLTFYGARAAFGFDPAGYHLISILLHALVSALVFFLVRRWSDDSLIALFTSLLFAAHPVHTENVCWISGYPDLEATLFVLLAWLIYTRPRHSVVGTLGVAVCFLLGLLSKEIAIVVPVICLAWELFEDRDLRTIVRERWLDYSAMTAVLAAYLAMRWNALGGLAPFAQRNALTPGERLLTALALFYRYIEKLVLPLRLTAFHMFPPSLSVLDWRVIAGLILLLLFVWGACLLWRAHRPEVLGLAIFAGALAPAFSLPYGNFNLMSERYLYLPSLGFCWLAAWGLSECVRRTNARVGGLILAGILAAYALRTEARNLDWHAEIPFYQKSIAMAPDLPELHLLLGNAYLRRQMLPEAMAETQLAAALKPDYLEAANNLGQIYSQLDQPEKAAEQYRLAIQYAQKLNMGSAAARAYNNLARELNRLGRTDEAIVTYRQAIALNPAFAGAYNNLGYLFLEHGQHAEAETNLLRALQLEPAFPTATRNLGVLYTRTGNYDEAIRYLNEASRLEPRSGETYAQIGELALARGDRAQAADSFRHALELQPDNQTATNGLRKLTTDGHR